jgi:hypothetical protein
MDKTQRTSMLKQVVCTVTSMGFQVLTAVVMVVFATCYNVGFLLGLFSNLKIEAICSFET